MNKPTQIAHPVVELDQTQGQTVQAIWRLWQVAYTYEANLIGAKDFPPLARAIADIRASKTLFLGVKQGSNLVGVLELDQQYAPDKLSIDALTVHPHWFRHGIARSLMQAVLDRKARRIRVSTAAANTPAVTLYLRMGFVAVCERTTREGLRLCEFEYRHSP